MNLPGRLRAGFAQRAQKPIAIGVLQKNRFPPIAPAHHVIKRAFILDPEGTGHTAHTAQSLILCQ
jgi:hypothetical protein